MFLLAKKQNCVLMDAIKTAYSTAYARMLLLVKSGVIGKVVSIDAVCTSLKKYKTDDRLFRSKNWNSIYAWGPTGLLPVLQLLGEEYKRLEIMSLFADKTKQFDIFSKINFIYDGAVASVKVGNGVKAEGELIISGTEGYVYVPAPWWKTDYFEIRYEEMEKNKRYFYQLDGEGIRYEIVAFLKAIENNNFLDIIPQNISEAICKIIAHNKTDLNDIIS